MNAKLHSVTLLTGLLLTLSVHAAPPYMAVSSGATSGSANACVLAASRVLSNDGFAKITRSGNSVFAAYRNSANYGYKVTAKCASGSVTIVTVANSLSNISAKAQNLRARIQNTLRRK